MKIRRLVFGILAVLWMALIFSMSGKVADESAAESHGLIGFIGEHFVPGFDEWDESRREAFIEKYDHPVRKAAHMAEYAILAILLTGALYTGKEAGGTDGRRGVFSSPYLIAWLISAIYAASDEFHQTFVPGRSGEVKDVCIDSLGALIGVFLAVIAISVIKYLIIIVNALNKCAYYNTLMPTNRQGKPRERGSDSAQKETNKFVSYKLRRG